jgi:hypothetical protein
MTAAMLSDRRTQMAATIPAAGQENTYDSCYSFCRTGEHRRQPLLLLRTGEHSLQLLFLLPDRRTQIKAAMLSERRTQDDSCYSCCRTGENR